MKQAWHIVFSIAMLLSASACQKEGAGCFESRGDQSSERRELEQFNDLRVDGRINVILVQDTLNFAIITFGEKGLAGIETNWSDGELRIEETNTCNWTRKVNPLPEVELHFSTFKNLYTKSAAEVSFQNAFEADSLNIEINDAAGSVFVKVDCQYISIIGHTGATDVTAEGTTDNLYIYNSSYAPIHAEDLTARVASVHNNSSGDTYVRATQRLNTTIEEDGDIYLYGSAAVRGTPNGSGQVFLMGE